MTTWKRKLATSWQPAVAHIVMSAAILIQTACSDSEGTSGGSDANSESMGGAAGSDAGEDDGGTGCTTIDPLGEVVVGEYVAGSPPTPTGGAVADATYDAVSYATYVSALPPPGTQPPRVFRSALRISSGATYFEMVDAHPDQSGGELVLRYNGALMISAPSSMRFNWMCPAELVNNPETWQFSVSGDELVLFVENNEMTFLRR